MWVCGGEVTDGMCSEIREAVTIGVPIRYIKAGVL